MKSPSRGRNVSGTGFVATKAEVPSNRRKIMLGSCLCGEIQYACDVLDMSIVHCHCRSCRKAHAAVYASTAGVRRENFRWLKGQTLLRSFESSPGKLRHFCSVCGTHLMAERKQQAHVIVRAATLDDDPGVTPAAHIWCSHDVPWLKDGQGVSSYPEGRSEG